LAERFHDEQGEFQMLLCGFCSRKETAFLHLLHAQPICNECILKESRGLGLVSKKFLVNILQIPASKFNKLPSYRIYSQKEYGRINAKPETTFLEQDIIKHVFENDVNLYCKSLERKGETKCRSKFNFESVTKQQMAVVSVIDPDDERFWSLLDLDAVQYKIKKLGNDFECSERIFPTFRLKTVIGGSPCARKNCFLKISRGMATETLVKGKHMDAKTIKCQECNVMKPLKHFPKAAGQTVRRTKAERTCHQCSPKKKRTKNRWNCETPDESACYVKKRKLVAGDSYDTENGSLSTEEVSDSAQVVRQLNFDITSN
jgi:hypothetical protein